MGVQFSEADFHGKDDGIAAKQDDTQLSFKCVCQNLWGVIVLARAIANQVVSGITGPMEDQWTAS